MATRDLQSLYELYRQGYGGQIGLPQLPQPGRAAQIHEPAGVSGNYSPTAGVLGYLPTPPAAVLAGMQNITPVGVGFRPPLSGTRLRLGGGVPMPDGSTSVQDMPDPHLERLVPDWMRDFWAAGTLLPKIIASDTSGHGGRAGATQGDALPSSQPQSVKQEDRSGGLGWYVGPPDKRILQRVDDSAGEEVESPPLAPKDPVDTVDEEACAEEWADARKKCEEGFRGPRGDGPYSVPKGPRGRKYSIEDCARGIVSAICGGNPLKGGLSGEQRAKRNNERTPQGRKGRGQ
jgi:hypothetical protein